MKIYQRLLNIWRLGNLDVSFSEDGRHMNMDFSPAKEESRMAQIVNMKKPVEEFLKDNQN